MQNKFLTSNSRRPVKLTLGQEYIVSIFGKSHYCLFIQTTTKGFNFLDLDTNKCILLHHLYVSKISSDETWFFVNCVINIYKNNNTKFA